MFVLLWILCLFPPAVFKLFSLSLVLSYWITLYTAVISFKVLVLGVCCTYWIQGFIVVSKLGRFLSIIIFFNIISFPLPVETSVKGKLDCLKLFHCSITLLSLSLILFLLCFLLHGFYCHGFNFPKLFSYNVKSVINPTQCIFYL